MKSFSFKSGIPTPIKNNRTSNSHFENLTPTPQLDIKFLKKDQLSYVFLKHLTFGMIFKKSCKTGKFENLTPTPQLNIKF